MKLLALNEGKISVKTLSTRLYEQLYDFCEMFPRASVFTAHEKTLYLALRGSIEHQLDLRGLDFSPMAVAALLAALDLHQAQRHGSPRQIIAARGKFKREIDWLAQHIEATEIQPQPMVRM